ncbi:MAG: succinyl-diaminopimelate desuccinylase [Pseudomonadota bacterium]
MSTPAHAAEPSRADVRELTQALIERQSVTPADGGCQALLGARLEALGFELTPLKFGAVDNLWATWGTDGPWLVFAGHTDVVPTGPAEQWRSPPFEATEYAGMLYGRGAADMKASLAAMIVAVERLVQSGFSGLRLAFLLTSDEEGPAIDGTVRVVDWLEARGLHPEYCLVGEPSSSERLGDVVRNGRRGSLNATLRVKGIQGHVAYPEQVRNPIHLAMAPLAALVAEHWDAGNEYYPPTSLQISNVAAGTGATNVVPGSAEFRFNFRYSTEQTEASLRTRVHALLDRFDLDYELDWQLSGEPFLTPRGALTDAVQTAIREITGGDCELSTAGGTSDGRFIARLGTQIVELGPVNATIHQVDECVALSDLDPLARLYEAIARKLAQS